MSYAGASATESRSRVDQKRPGREEMLRDLDGEISSLELD
jgi:hypothetical protein